MTCAVLVWYRFEEAERLCRSAINILEKSVGEDDVNVAAALSLQATCLQYALDPKTMS